MAPLDTAGFNMPPKNNIIITSLFEGGHTSANLYLRLSGKTNVLLIIFSHTCISVFNYVLYYTVTDT